MTASKKGTSRLEGLLRSNLQTDSEAEDDTMTPSNASTEPWKIEYDLYFATVEVGLNGTNIVQWWGVSKLTLSILFPI
jgi:hypothetical protein